MLARDHKFGGALRAGGAVLLAVILLWLLGVSGSGEQPTPTDPHHNLLGSECLWHWKAFPGCAHADVKGNQRTTTHLLSTCRVAERFSCRIANLVTVVIEA